MPRLTAKYSANTPCGAFLSGGGGGTKHCERMRQSASKGAL